MNDEMTLKEAMKVLILATAQELDDPDIDTARKCVQGCLDDGLDRVDLNTIYHGED